jgi:glycosyltransferase involved in cell wall biosynthesis
MAVFNTDFKLVKRAIDSVLAQDFQDFEFIIIDDGSHNCGQHLLLKYVIEHQDRVIYIRHANRGQSESINRGVLNASGEYITILDADDEYKPNHLSACLQEMEFADLIASTTETIVDEELDFYVPDKNNRSVMVHVDDCILFATLFGKREVFQKVKFQSKYAADAQFFEFASLYFNVKKVNLKTYIYYRNIPNSTCAVLKKQAL